MAALPELPSPTEPDDAFAAVVALWLTEQWHGIHAAVVALIGFALV